MSTDPYQLSHERARPDFDIGQANLSAFLPSAAMHNLLTLRSVFGVRGKKGALMGHVRLQTLMPAATVAAFTAATVAGVGTGGMPSASAAPSRAAGPTPAVSICTSAKHPRLAARISSGITAALAGRSDSGGGLATADPAEGLSRTMHQTWPFYPARLLK